MRFKKLFIIEVFLFFLYLLAVYTFPLVADFISPIHNVLAASIIFMVAQKINMNKSDWHLTSLMIMLWGIGGLIYLVSIDKGYVTLSNIIPVMITRLISNTIMLIIVVKYFIRSFRKWNKIQLTANVVMSTTVIIGTIAGIYFSKLDNYTIDSKQVVGIILVLSIDLITLLIIFTTALSTRLKSKYNIKIGLIFALCIHILADIIDVYGIIIGRQDTIVLTEILVLLSYILFTLAALLHLKYMHTYNRDAEVIIREEMDRSKNLSQAKVFLSLAIILLILYLEELLNTKYFLLLMISILVYAIVTALVQKNIVSDLRSKEEKTIKEQLEGLVKEECIEHTRTNEVSVAQISIDPLTGLQNREYFYKELQTRISKGKEPFSVFIINLDQFKSINDTHGQIMGDKVLKEIALRFKDGQCDRCRFARFAGDEFTVVYNSTDLQELDNVGNQLYTYINEKLRIDDYEFSLEASIGMVRYPQDADNVNELLKYAEIAMKQAKKSKQLGNYVIYSKDYKG